MSRSRLCLLALAVVLTAFVVTSLDLDEDEFENEFDELDVGRRGGRMRKGLMTTMGTFRPYFAANRAGNDGDCSYQDNDRANWWV